MNKGPLTRSQWIGAAVLIIMVIAVKIFVHIVPQRPIPVTELSDADTSQIDSISWHKHTFHRWTKDTIDIVLKPFDPNTADSTTLVHLGLRTWQVKNLLKYRACHGVYHTKEDFRKLYGLTDSLYSILEPYIDIDTTLFSTKNDSVSFPKYHSVKRDTVLDINTADTATLQFIKGIGKSVAIQIVRYREQLGGYVSVNQIREIEKLQLLHKDSNISFCFDSVIPHLVVLSDSIRTIPVNRAGIDRLTKHPYLNYEQAERIYQYRRRHFQIKSKEELHEVVPDSIYQRIIPYLSFEDK